MIEIPKPNPLSKPNPRCCICGNAYGTRFVCSSCKDDPANIDWLEGDETSSDVCEASVSERVPWGEGEPWRPTELFVRVVQLLQKAMSRRAIAAELGCTHAYVDKVADEVGFCRKNMPTFGRHVLTLAARGMAAAAAKQRAGTS